MLIEIPDTCGEMLSNKEISSMHIYIDQNGEVSNIRAYKKSEVGYTTLFSKKKGVNIYE